MPRRFSFYSPTVTPYPYEKQNLVPYRDLLGVLILAVLLAVAFGILFKRPAGHWFAALTLLTACGGPLRTAFFPHSEPTARRQYLTAFLLMLVVAVLGFFGIDALLIGYHSMRGECPIWMDFSGYCDVSPG